MKLKSLFALDAYGVIYNNQITDRIKSLSDVIGITDSAAISRPELLRGAQVIFSGWGAPKMDTDFLNAAPELQIVFYGAGSIRPMVTDEFWNRGIRVCSAWGANGVPVSEYCLAQIIFALKCGNQMEQMYRRSRGKMMRPDYHIPGGYKSTVGIVSAGMIGRRVISLLKSCLDVNILVYEEYISESEAKEMGIKKAGLDEIFAASDVVTLHTALIPENVGLINGGHIASMKQGATLINSSRGAIIRENEMLDVLEKRPDLFAVLDVTDPEPPADDSRIWELPNVRLTPHIAGSLSDECFRHGEFMADELERYINGEPLKYEISRERFEKMA